jgi:hypothetical protein
MDILSPGVEQGRPHGVTEQAERRVAAARTFGQQDAALALLDVQDSPL